MQTSVGFRNHPCMGDRRKVTDSLCSCLTQGHLLAGPVKVGIISLIVKQILSYLMKNSFIQFSHANSEDHAIYKHDCLLEVGPFMILVMWELTRNGKRFRTNFASINVYKGLRLLWSTHIYKPSTADMIFTALSMTFFFTACLCLCFDPPAGSFLFGMYMALSLLFLSFTQKELACRSLPLLGAICMIVAAFAAIL